MERFKKVTLLLCVVFVLQCVLLAFSLNASEAKAATVSGNGVLSPYACAWSVVPVPQPSGNSGLSAVSAASANAIWAVGTSGSQITGDQTLIETWNGASWQIMSSPNPSLTNNTLYGVAAISTTNVWAVGYYASVDGSSQTLTEHWNGTRWSIVKSPSPGSFSTQLLGVAAVSANNVWTVGYADSNPLIEHYHC